VSLRFFLFCLFWLFLSISFTNRTIVVYLINTLKEKCWQFILRRIGQGCYLLLLWKLLVTYDDGFLVDGVLMWLLGLDGDYASWVLLRTPFGNLDLWHWWDNNAVNGVSRRFKVKILCSFYCFLRPCYALSMYWVGSAWGRSRRLKV